jgi:uncharacterized protein involved in outer membrane biogenesis
MWRWCIAIGVAVVVLGSVLAVAVANLSHFLAVHRERLATRVARELGRPVRFDGMSVSLRGGPGVRITGVRVLEDPTWGGGDLLRADEVRVTVRLLPALAGRFAIRRITVRRPVLTVIRDQRGLNLSTLGRRARRKRDRGGAQKGSGPASLLIALADVRDGTVRYLDRRRDPTHELTAEQVELSASDVRPGSPIGVELRAAVLGSEAVNLKVTGSIGPLGDPPAPARTPCDLRWRLGATEAASLVPVATALDLAPRGLIVAGPITGHGSLHGTLEELAGEATIDASPAALRLGNRLAKAPGVVLRADLAASRDGASLALSRGTVALGEGTLEASGVLHPGSPVTAELRLDSNRVPLATLASLVPAAATAEVGGTMEAHLAGDGTMPRGLSGTIALVDVSLRRPDVGLAFSELTSTLVVADGIATLPSTRALVGGIPVQVQGAWSFAERLLTAEASSTDVFGGVAEARTRIALRGPKPRFTLDGSSRGVALGPLLAARGSRLAHHLDGRLDAEVSLAGAGARRRAVRRSLEGTARVDVHDGVLRGVKIVDEVLGPLTGVDRPTRMVPAPLRRKRPELFGGADTVFEELHGTARIADRRATSDDLVMRTAAYTVRGRGEIQFDGHVDVSATFVASPALTAEVLESVKHARWVTNQHELIEVPFRLAGRFPDVRARPDPAFVARAVGRALEARLRKALGGDDTKKDGANGGVIGDAIRGLQQLLGR